MPKVQNVDRLKRKLALLRDGPRRAMSDVIGQEAPALADAIRNVAHGERLKQSVDWAWGNAPDDAKLSGGERTEAKALLGQKGLAATVFAGSKKVFWAFWEEFGTKPHKNAGLFEGTEHPGTAARPFFYGTFRLRRKGIRSRIAGGVRNAIKAAVK